MKKQLLYFISLLCLALSFFGMVEVSLSYLLDHPDKCPKYGLTLLKNYHIEYDRSIIQCEPEMARYDSILYYTLKPGEFTFSNREYSTPYYVNRLGLRDDEASIEHPKIVMLGDSYGMGWGVLQANTYANIVEQTLNKKVLNAGVSSYGTVRELALLDRIATDSMEYLIIQHCSNDDREIKKYVNNGLKLAISNEQSYLDLCALISERTTYFPYKQSIRIFSSLLGIREKRTSTLDNETNKMSPQDIQKAFLGLIKNSDNIPPTTRIYVFTLDAQGFDNQFMNKVKATLEAEKDSVLLERITFLDFSNSLEDVHYFLLDDHLNALGHRLVADTLIKNIGGQIL